MANFCTNCGGTIRPDAKFCEHCGNAIVQREIERTVNNKHPPQPQKSDNWAPFIIICLIFLIMLEFV